MKETVAVVEGNDGVTVLLLSTVRASLAVKPLKDPKVSVDGDATDDSELLADKNAGDTEDLEGVAVLEPRPDQVALVPPKVDSTSLELRVAVLREIDSVRLAFSEVEGSSSENGFVV